MSNLRAAASGLRSKPSAATRPERTSYWHTSAGSSLCKMPCAPILGAVMSGVIGNLSVHCSSIAKLRKASIAGAQRGLSAVSHLDLAKDLRYVVAHRLGAEYQALGDRQVGMPLRLNNRAENSHQPTRQRERAT